MAIKIPKSVNEWTLYNVEELVDASYFETDSFEFKSLITNPEDHKYKTKLCKTACAFANSNGGFIIFGVADRASKKLGRSRITGVAKTDDLSRLFGDQISSCEPTIFYEPQNPPIPLLTEKDRVNFIVNIPKSNQTPHGFKDKELFSFYRRTNKGNEPMSFAELGMAFTRRLVTRDKVQFLSDQLKECSERASDGMTVKVLEDKRLSYPIAGWEPSVLEYTTAELYPIFKGDKEILYELSYVVRLCRVINNVIINFEVLKETMGSKKATERHNRIVGERIILLEESVKKSQKLLKRRYLK